MFASIIRARPYDTSRVMAIISPNNEGFSENAIDLATLDCSRETDYFTLKFLLANSSTEAKSPAVATRGESEAKASKINDVQEDEELVMTDTDTVKKYALVSYMKLLTTRVLRLEEEMRLQKKTSVVVVNRLDDAENEQEA